MTIAQEHSFGFSPPNSNSSPDDSESALGSMGLYDEDSKDGLFDDDKPRKMTGRKGPGPVAADKRATHNAIERARRESLNGRFMTLAEALPSMVNVKRPSKSIIVNKALDFVFDAQVKEHALIKENNDLRRQVDQLRARLGMAPLPPPAPLLAPVSKGSKSASSSSTYHQSFSSAAGEVMGDDTGPLVGSPGSIASSPATAPTSPIDMASSPTLAYPNMFGAAPSPSMSSMSSMDNKDVNINPAQLSGSASSLSGSMQLSPQLQQQQAQAQAMLQSQYGFMNPSMLSSQHSALLAMHLQQQQQALHQHHSQQQQQQQIQEMYGLATSSAPLGNWGGYNPTSSMDSYSFMSQ
ncbi:hypothetical protein RQP46_005199 [Phenoliferia psychrophenolica]